MIIDKTTGEEIHFRTPYNYDRNQASEETGLSCPEKTLAQQQFAEESDINNLVAKFAKTDLLKQVVDLVPLQDEFIAVTDYKQAADAVIKANDAFMQFDAKTRARFDNNPGAMLEWLGNPENRQEAEELGLVAKKPAEPAPTKVEIVNPPKQAEGVTQTS